MLWQAYFILFKTLSRISIKCSFIFRVTKVLKSSYGSITMFLSKQSGLIQAPRLLHKLKSPLNISILLKPPPNHLIELRKHLSSKQHWSCSKPKLKINRSRFAKLISRDDEVQQIVHQLEGDANVPPVLESLLHHGGVDPRQHGIGPAAVCWPLLRLYSNLTDSSSLFCSCMSSPCTRLARTWLRMTTTSLSPTWDSNLDPTARIKSPPILLGGDFGFTFSSTDSSSFSSKFSPNSCPRYSCTIPNPYFRALVLHTGS